MSSPTHMSNFLKIAVDMKASGQQCVLKLWLAVSKGMLIVKYLCSTKHLFVSVEFNGGHKTAYIDEVKFGHPQFWGYYQIKNCGVCLS